MSIKRNLVLAAAGLAALGTTAAMAGGPDVDIAPVAPQFVPYVYIEGNVGYAGVDWKSLNRRSDFINPARDHIFKHTNSNGEGGFTGGVDLGYMFTRHFGIEGGWYWLPRVKGTSWGGFPYGVYNKELRISSWFAYVAGKVVVPLFDNFDLFGKAGVAYRNLDYSGYRDNGHHHKAEGSRLRGYFPGEQHYWRPVFAVGGQYVLDNAWVFDVQYMRVSDYLNFNHPARRAPSVNSWTFSLGYMFDV